MVPVIAAPSYNLPNRAFTYWDDKQIAGQVRNDRLN